MQKPEVKNHFRLFKNYMNTDFFQIMCDSGLSMVNSQFAFAVNFSEAMVNFELLKKFTCKAKFTIHHSPFTFSAKSFFMLGNVKSHVFRFF